MVMLTQAKVAVSFVLIAFSFLMESAPDRAARRFLAGQPTSALA